jgi:hypothetical protein
MSKSISEIEHWYFKTLNYGQRNYLRHGLSRTTKITDEMLVAWHNQYCIGNTNIPYKS